MVLSLIPHIEDALLPKETIALSPLNLVAVRINAAMQEILDSYRQAAERREQDWEQARQELGALELRVEKYRNDSVNFFAALPDSQDDAKRYHELSKQYEFVKASNIRPGLRPEYTEEGSLPAGAHWWQVISEDEGFSDGALFAKLFRIHHANNVEGVFWFDYNKAVCQAFATMQHPDEPRLKHFFCQDIEFWRNGKGDGRFALKDGIIFLPRFCAMETDPEQSEIRESGYSLAPKGKRFITFLPQGAEMIALSEAFRLCGKGLAGETEIRTAPSLGITHTTLRTDWSPEQRMTYYELDSDRANELKAADELARQGRQELNALCAEWGCKRIDAESPSFKEWGTQTPSFGALLTGDDQTHKEWRSGWNTGNGWWRTLPAEAQGTEDHIRLTDIATKYFAVEIFFNKIAREIATAIAGTFETKTGESLTAEDPTFMNNQFFRQLRATKDEPVSYGWCYETEGSTPFLGLPTLIYRDDNDPKMYVTYTAALHGMRRMASAEIAAILEANGELPVPQHPAAMAHSTATPPDTARP